MFPGDIVPQTLVTSEEMLLKYTKIRNLALEFLEP